MAPSLRDDLLTGAAEISEYLGPKWPPRRVYYAAEKGYLPINYCGAILISRKSSLDAALTPPTNGRARKSA